MFMYRQKSSEIDTFTHNALVLFDIRVLIVLLFSTSHMFFVIQYSVANGAGHSTLFTQSPQKLSRDLGRDGEPISISTYMKNESTTTLCFFRQFNLESVTLPGPVLDLLQGR